MSRLSAREIVTTQVLLLAVLVAAWSGIAAARELLGLDLGRCLEAALRVPMASAGSDSR